MAKATCRGNASLTNVAIRSGFWRLSSMTTDVQRCPLGSGLSCRGGQNASEYCAPGLGGPLCSTCISDDKFVKKERCTPCPGVGKAVANASIFVGGVLACVLLFVMLYTELRGFSAWVVRTQARARLMIGVLELQTKFRYTIGLVQTLDQMSSTFDLELPRELVRLLSYMNFLRLDWSILVPRSCIGFSFGLLAQTMLPWVFVLFIVLASVLSAAVRDLKERRCINASAIGSSVKSGLLTAVSWSLPLSYALLIPCATVVFESFSCKEFRRNDHLFFSGHRDDEAVAYFLTTDLSVRCTGGQVSIPSVQPPSPEHETILTRAYVAMLLWPIGVPLVYCALLARASTAIQARRPTSVSRSIQFLHSGYKPRFLYWEVLDLIRRLVLIGVLRFVPKDGLPVSRLLVGAGLALFFLFALLWLRPHENELNNLFGAVVHLCVVLMLLASCSIEMHQRALYGDLIDGQQASQTMLGFGHLDQLTQVMVIVPSATAVLMLGVTLFSWAFLRIPYSFVDKATNKAVLLSLEQQHVYHLFLSHIWSGYAGLKPTPRVRQGCLFGMVAAAAVGFY